MERQLGFEDRGWGGRTGSGKAVTEPQRQELTGFSAVENEAEWAGWRETQKCFLGLDFGFDPLLGIGLITGHSYSFDQSCQSFITQTLGEYLLCYVLYELKIDI